MNGSLRHFVGFLVTVEGLQFKETGIVFHRGCNLLTLSGIRREDCDLG